MDGALCPRCLGRHLILVQLRNASLRKMPQPSTVGICKVTKSLRIARHNPGIAREGGGDKTGSPLAVHHPSALVFLPRVTRSLDLCFATVCLSTPGVGLKHVLDLHSTCAPTCFACGSSMLLGKAYEKMARQKTCRLLPCPTRWAWLRTCRQPCFVMSQITCQRSQCATYI